jgi:hypothetical protein
MLKANNEAGVWHAAHGFARARVVSGIGWPTASGSAFRKIGIKLGLTFSGRPGLRFSAGGSVLAASSVVTGIALSRE